MKTKKILFCSLLAFSLLFGWSTMAQQDSLKPVSKSLKSIQPKDNFVAIDVSQVSPAVNAAVKNDFNGAEIRQAFLNKQKEYKLEIKVNNREIKTVYANANGEWIKPSE